jgi:two-component sensor histidine kinase
VLTELLQNAVEHAFPESFLSEEEGHVDVELENDESELTVRVSDNGVGLPEGFSIELTKSLGLSIVRDLVRTQLNGSITMRTDGGTEAELRIPVGRS